MKNQFFVLGDRVLIRLIHKKAGEMFTEISLHDLDKAHEFTGWWLAQWCPHISSFYCAGNIKLPCGRWTKVYLHRWITAATAGFDVDHFNNDTLNNCRHNLRVVSHAQNHQNRKGATKGNVSGVRGVQWRKDKQKWAARYKINGISVHLGFFNTITEAEKSIKIARASTMPYSKEAK